MPGNIVDVPEKEAELLVRGRYAVYMENPPPTDEPPTDEPPSEEPSTGKKKTGHAAKK